MRFFFLEITMEMRKVLEQEGRDAKNLVVYHFPGNFLPPSNAAEQRENFEIFFFITLLISLLIYFIM